MVLLALAVFGLTVTVVAGHGVVLVLIVLLLLVLWLAVLGLVVLRLSPETGAGWLFVEILLGLVAASTGLSCEWRLLGLVHHSLVPETAY